MSHIRYTISRSCTYYYNRRVPSHAVSLYGTHIRQALSSCRLEAEAYSTRLSNALEASWTSCTSTTPINISATNNPYTTGDNMMQPTLVCDSKDRLHLAAVHYRQSATEYSVVY